MCVVTNERYKTYHTRFLFCRLGHALGVRLGCAHCIGAKIKFRPAVCLLCYLLPNHWTKLNQIWCVSYSHERGEQRQFSAPPSGALGRGKKVKYHLISITKSISKIFIPNCVCVPTNERYKTYQTGFFILLPCICPGYQATNLIFFQITNLHILPISSHKTQYLKRTRNRNRNLSDNNIYR